MKTLLILKVFTILGLLSACSNDRSSSGKLQGRPESGGILKLVVGSYEKISAYDPRIMKSKDITFLNNIFVSYSFSQFLIDDLAKNEIFHCEMLELGLNEKASLITQVVEQTNSQGQKEYKVIAADISCELPASGK
jgi:hypothetical protein